MTTQSTSTLLELVRAVNSYTADDQEVVATVTYLVNSGKVCLGGISRGPTLTRLTQTQSSTTCRRTVQTSRSPD